MPWPNRPRFTILRSMQRVSGKMDEDRLLARTGAAIRLIRRERGISQEALADAASLDRSHLGRIERGERNLTLLNLVKVARALETRAWELLRAADI